jgi:hypothetical protein
LAKQKKLMVRETWPAVVPAFRCGADLNARLEAEAKRRGVPKAAIVRTALDRFLRDNSSQTDIEKGAS